MDEGSHTSLMTPPWTNDQSWTHESLGTIHSLLVPTNESYFPVEERKKKKKTSQGENRILYFLSDPHPHENTEEARTRNRKKEMFPFCLSF